MASMLLDNLEIDCIIEDGNYCEKLGKGLTAENIVLREQVYKLLIKLCNYSSRGHARVLEILDNFKELHGYQYRFKPLVDELKVERPESYLANILSLINVVISGAEDECERIRIRNEFIGIRLLNHIDHLSISYNKSDVLMKQVDIFSKQMFIDDQHRLDIKDVDTNCPLDVFYGILKQVSGTPQEVVFLSILQHLLLIGLDKRNEDNDDEPMVDGKRCDIMTWEYVEKAVYSATLVATKAEGQKLLLRLSQTHGPQDLSSELNVKSGDGLPMRLNKSHDSLAKNKSCSCLCHESETAKLKTVIQQVNCSNDDKQVSSCNIVPPPPPPPLPPPMPPCTAVGNPVKPVPQPPKLIIAGYIPKQHQSICSDKNAGNASNLCHTTKIGHPQTTKDVTDKRSPTAAARFVSQSNNILNSPESTVGETLPQQRTPTPKSKLKTVNWIRIPLMKVLSTNNHNVWTMSKRKNMGQQYDIDFGYLEELFMMQQNMNGTLGSNKDKEKGKYGDPESRSNAGEIRKRDTGEILLLEPKRNLNISIFLKQFKNGYEEIITNLERGNGTKIGTEKLRGLLKILPETYEIEVLQSYTGDVNRLGIAEKFLRQLISLPNYQLTIEGLLLKEDFMNNLDEILPALDMIIYTSQDIKNCVLLHEVLLLTVFVGNFINSGGYAGNAAGIKLSSLLKITEIRGNNPKIGLLHFVAKELKKHNIILSNLLAEIKYLENVQKVNMESLISEISSITTKCGNLSSQVSKSDGKLRNMLQEFLKYAKQEMDSIQDDLITIEKWRVMLADFFCEERATFKLEECFKIFYNFINKLKKADEENNVRQQMEEKAKLYKEKLYNSTLSLNSNKIQIKNTPRKSIIPEDCKRENYKDDHEDTKSSETSSLFTEQDNDSLRSGSPGSLKRRVSKSPLPSSNEDLMDYLNNTTEDLHDLHNFSLRRDRRGGFSSKSSISHLNRLRRKEEEAKGRESGYKFQRERSGQPGIDKDTISLPLLVDAEKRGQHDRQLSLPEEEYKGKGNGISHSPTSVSDSFTLTQFNKQKQEEELVPLVGAYGQLRKSRDYVFTHGNAQRDSGFIEQNLHDDEECLDNTICESPSSLTKSESPFDQDHSQYHVTPDATLSVSQIFASLEEADFNKKVYTQSYEFRNNNQRRRLNDTSTNKMVSPCSDENNTSVDHAKPSVAYNGRIRYSRREYEDTRIMDDPPSRPMQNTQQISTRPSTKFNHTPDSCKKSSEKLGEEKNGTSSTDESFKYKSVTWNTKLDMLKDKYSQACNGEEDGDKVSNKSLLDDSNSQETGPDFYKQVLLHREKRNLEIPENLEKSTRQNVPYKSFTTGNNQCNLRKDPIHQQKPKSRLESNETKLPKQQLSSKQDGNRRATFSIGLSKVNISNSKLYSPNNVTNMPTSSLVTKHKNEKKTDNIIDKAKRVSVVNNVNKQNSDKSFKKEVSITITYDRNDRNNKVDKGLTGSTINLQDHRVTARYSAIIPHSKNISKKSNSEVAAPASLHVKKRTVDRVMNNNGLASGTSNDSLSTIPCTIIKSKNRSSNFYTPKLTTQNKRTSNDSSCSSIAKSTEGIDMNNSQGNLQEINLVAKDIGKAKLVKVRCTDPSFQKSNIRQNPNKTQLSSSVKEWKR